MATRTPRKTKLQAFYEVPSNVATSSKIIEEARRSLKGVRISRPATPTPDGRHLFGASSTTIGHSSGTSKPMLINHRPPSVFSVGNGQYKDESQSALASATSTNSVEEVMHASESAPIVSSKPVKSGVISNSHSSPSTSNVDRIMKKSVLSISENDYSQLAVDGVMIDEGAGGLEKPIASSIGTHRLSKSEINAIWEKQVVPLMAKLEDPQLTDIDEIHGLCDMLWSVLKDNGMVGKTAGLAGTKRRNLLLRNLFKLLSQKDTLMLIKLSKVILAMKVTGSNLLNTCKLIFYLSKEDNNDKYFISEYITEFLINVLNDADILQHQEVMVYGIGAIKLLACNPVLRERLINEGCVEMLANCLQKCTQLQETKETIANILIQLIIALRNLSDAAVAYEQFINCSIPQHLYNVLKQYPHNVELVFNISRLLSKLTLAEDCRKAISQSYELMSLLPQLLPIHLNYEDTVVRICFVMSNVLYDNAELSLSLCQSHSLLSSIIEILNGYCQRLNEYKSNEGETKIFDVLLKLISLLANISVHPSVADITTNNEELTSHLLYILESISLSQSERLIVSTLATLNNLSYYSQDIFIMYKERTINILAGFISPESHEILLESTRVLGNLTRQLSIRETIRERRVDELLITLMDSKHVDLVHAVCGVLINLLVDHPSQVTFKSNNGMKKILDIISCYGRQDWLLATLSCQIIWNYSEGLANINVSFSDEEILMLSNLLEEFLDPITAFDSYMEEQQDNDDDNDDEGCDDVDSKQHWINNFSPLATRILQKIQNNKMTFINT